MPKIAYEECVMKPASLATALKAEEICREYEADGWNLTLRQLYYQFVARGLLPNRQAEYDRLGRIVSDARLCGIIDWNQIEDRTRAAYRNIGMDESPEDAIQLTAGSYRRNHWEGQENYVEVWVEKEALAGVVQRPADELEITYFSCRGYVSQSEMWRAGRRLSAYPNPYVFHLGDHDPSGIDMSRDIQDRLATFMGARRRNLTFKRIALNMDQVEQYNPPPNPVKMTDSRWVDYADRYGRESWELDALEPAVLGNLIRSHVEPLIDRDVWGQSLDRESREQTQLQQVSDRWDEVEEFLTG